MSFVICLFFAVIQSWGSAIYGQCLCIYVCRQIKGVFKLRFRGRLLNNSSHKEVRSTILLSGVHSASPGEC